VRGPQDFENPLCAQTDPEAFFPEKGQPPQWQVKYTCRRCEHQVECAEWGIRHERFGIWGGLSEAERRRIRKELNIKLRLIPLEVYLAKTVSRLGNSNNEGDTTS